MYSVQELYYLFYSVAKNLFLERKQILYYRIIICNYSFREKYWSNISEDAKEMVEMMMEHEPEKRITINQSLNHLWMTRMSDNEGNVKCS